MPDVRKSIVFVSYYGHQARLFGPMSKATSRYARVKHLKIYPLTLERVLTSPFGHCNLQPESLDSITRYYRLKKTIKHPELNTPRWQAVLCQRATDWYRLFLRKLALADMLVVWNGFSIPVGSAVAAAKSLGIKTAFCENGVLPQMIAMDPKGINYANSISGKPAEFYQNTRVDPERAKALFETAFQQRPLRKAAESVHQDCDDDKPLPERYVLFAMQVHDDTQVVLFSPRFRSLKEAVVYTADRIGKYNARTGDTLELVVKEHPSDFGRMDHAELRASLPKAHFLRSRPIREIISDAKAVITLNSSVGVESLLYLRPVITLGDAFYDVSGMLSHLDSKDDLADILVNVIDKPVNAELITKFLYFLRYEYLVPMPRQKDGSILFDAATERILDILHERLPWAE